MGSDQLLLSPKYKAFLRHNAPVEFLEGTTAAGKTTVGAFKFMLKVAQSKNRIHILSGLDLGTIEKNIINKDLGILDIFGSEARYNPAGRGQHTLPHLSFRGKIIYILGYDNKARWKKALGGQYGCLYIDEINVADMEYVREASMRCDYLMATLNPDDPGLPVYEEYIFPSRNESHLVPCSSRPKITYSSLRSSMQILCLPIQSCLNHSPHRHIIIHHKPFIMAIFNKVG